jgi:hypothetical protein
MLRFQDCHWMPVSDISGITGPATELYSIAMDSPTDGWAVGAYDKSYPVAQANGTTTHTWGGNKPLVLHYASGQWRRVDLSAGDIDIGEKVVMISADEGWMLAEGGKRHTDPYTVVYDYHLFHYLDGAWNPVPLTFDTSGSLIISDVAAAAPGECWVVGYGTASGDDFAVAHYANGKWQAWSSEQVGASFVALNHIALTGPEDVWVAGSYPYHDARGDHTGPYVSRFTGTGWAKQDVPAAPDQGSVLVDLVSITMFSPAEGWAFDPATIPTLNRPQAKALHYVHGHWQWVMLPSRIAGADSLSLFSPTQGFAIVTLVNTLADTTVHGDLAYYDNGAWSVVPNR